MMAKDTICVILAGGKGSRLHPLTADRAKPSVPFGGKYRVIDFALSNCLHSGLRRILVLTQYKSHSLQKHLRDAWSIFSPDLGEYITAVPPQMRTGDSWYSGTADAIHQNMYLLERSGAKRVLILSGDHVYRMDYEAMVNSHNQQRADLSVACMKVPLADATGFGVTEVNEKNRIVQFDEKPEIPSSIPGDADHALASMGIYIFNIDILRRELNDDYRDKNSSHDFGTDLLPRLIQSRRVFGYRFGGSAGRVTSDRYWRDVGTLDAYYNANMDLLLTNPPLDLYQDSWSIRTFQGQHPPAKVNTQNRGKVHNSMLCNGCMVNGGNVAHSILSAGVRVESDALIDSCILFDNVHVGQGARLRRCIVDKNVHIPPGTEIGFDQLADMTRFQVSGNGIVAVSKEAFAHSPLSLGNFSSLT